METAGSVIVLVHAPLSVPGLGAPRPLGHDDLVHPQDCAGGVSGVLQGPLLSQHQIQYVGLQAVLNISRLSVNVEAHVLVSFTVSSVQFTDDLLGLHTRVLGQHSWNDLESLSKLVDGVLLQAGVSLGPLSHLSGQLDLRGSSTLLEALD